MFFHIMFFSEMSPYHFFVLHSALDRGGLRAVAASDDSTIKVIDLQTFTVVNSIPGKHCATLLSYAMPCPVLSSPDLIILTCFHDCCIGASPTYSAFTVLFVSAQSVRLSIDIHHTN